MREEGSLSNGVILDGRAADPAGSLAEGGVGIGELCQERGPK